MKTVHISFMPSLIKGVEKKTIQMAKAAREVGFDCDFYILNNDIDAKNENLIYKKFTPLKLPFSLKKQQQLFTHLLIAKNVDFDAYNFVILRYPGAFSIGGYYFFKKYGYKLITEHQTNEDVEYRLYRKGIINWMKFGLEPFCSRINLKNARAIIGVTQEIVELELQKSGTKPSLALSNGIDVDSIHFTPASLFEGDVLKLFFVASGESSWHGLDKVIETIKSYRGDVRIELHIVGGFDATKYSGIKIIAHGFLEGKALDGLFSQMHIGISSLGLERLGLKSASTLKSREYMARGVPFIYGYEDDDFSDTDLALKLQNIDIGTILEYTRRITAKHQKKMREFAQKRLNWRRKIAELKVFLQALMPKKRFDDPVLDFAFATLEAYGTSLGAKVLDLGCGEGKHLRLMLDAGYDAHGVDTMPSKISHANNERAILIDGKALPFADENFDAIFSYQVFEHIFDLKLVAIELYRILKKGGTIYSEYAATYPLRDAHTGLPPLHLLGSRKAIFLAFWFFGRVGIIDKKALRKKYLYLKKHLCYRSYGQMDSIFREAGFEVVDLTYERRASRLLNDGVGRPMELVRYKLYGEHGHSKNIGIFVQIYLSWHVFWYRLTKNRVILLRKNSD